jgi:dTDP-4-dehydrorhamnose 3,5-epimerase
MFLGAGGSVRRLATALRGPILVEPTVRHDERGMFLETFRTSEARRVGIDDSFVQENHSRSRRGVIRGMHFQLRPAASKLVRCARGAILDVLVDIRPESRCFGTWEAYRLDDESLRMLYVPFGFAHGFCVLSEIADVIYKQSAYWEPNADRGFTPLDPDVAIEWPIPAEEMVLSARDRAAGRLSELLPELQRI